MRTMLFIVGLLALTGCSHRSTKTDRVETWSTVPLGSVYETKTVTHLEKPFVHDSETTTKQTLVARSELEASIKLEISGASAQDIKIPLGGGDAQPCPGTTVTTAAEKCIVPAGTFDCTKTTVEVREGDVMKSTVTWTTKSIPVPIKSVVTNENLTTTTELTKVALLTDR